MSKRPRMIFDTTEVVRRAVMVRAAKRGLSTSEVITAALMAYLTPAELQEAEELLKETPESSPHPKRPRKP